jgi:hypothetical protein
MNESEGQNARGYYEAESSEDEIRRLRTVVDIFTRLAIACKSRTLYPADHPAAKDSIGLLYAVLTDSLNIIPEFKIHVGKESLIYEKQSIDSERESLRQLASRIRALNIREIDFQAGATSFEVETLVELLINEPEQVDCEGGAETFFFVKGVKNIRVLESMAHRAEDELEEAEESASEGGVEAETIIEPEDANRAQFYIQLMSDPERLAQSLLQIPEEEKRPSSKEEMADIIFLSLKDMSILIELTYSERKSIYYRSMAEALLFFETELRNLLLIRHLLPKIDEEPVCIGVLSQFSVQEMVDMLAYFFPIAPDLLPRTGDLLSIIGFTNMEIERAIELLRKRLIDLGEVPPHWVSKLKLGPEKEGEGARRAQDLPTMNDMGDFFGEYRQEEIEAIQYISEMDLWEESLVDTTPMLLDLLSLGPKLDNLNKAVELLQHSFWDLIEARQLDQAAAVLESTRAILNNGDPAFEPYRSDLNTLIEEATSTTAVHRIIHLAHDQRDDTEILEGFNRYMSCFGERGVRALIEVLGEEEEMSVRKYICDALTESCREHVHLLGAYVDDPRWYLVRNIVSIMAKYRTREIIPYLRRSMNNTNPKVRAEAVRALGLTGGYEASDLLMHGLENADEETRILCIRWLGRLGETRSVGKMVRMLEGKDLGAESMRVKKEIIMTLGNIDDPQVYTVLKKYSHHRRLRNRSEWEEINVTARESMEQMMHKFPHLGRK